MRVPAGMLTLAAVCVLIGVTTPGSLEIAVFGRAEMPLTILSESNFTEMMSARLY